MFASGGPVLYDEQLSLSFVENFTDLAVNVTAVPQCGDDGLGPAYLLNGLTDTGYWYQVGLSWNWPLVRTDLYGNVNVTYSSGFNAAFETWFDIEPLTPPTLTPVKVSPGDIVRLGLSFTGGSVSMEVHDLTDGARATLQWSAFHAKRFVGTSQATNGRGLFTGFMTEQYHTSLYTGDEQSVTYDLVGPPLSAAWMVFDEWVPGEGRSVFSQATRVNFTGPSDFYSLDQYGTLETSSSQEFQTGSLGSGPTCAPIIPFWETYKYPIIGVGAATAAITGTLFIRRRNRTKVQDQKNDSPTTLSAPTTPRERPPYPSP